MIRPLFLAMMLMLAACAAPHPIPQTESKSAPPSSVDAAAPTGGLVEPVMEPEIIALPRCTHGDDGIGGTGCRQD